MHQIKTNDAQEKDGVNVPTVQEARVPPVVSAAFGSGSSNGSSVTMNWVYV